MAGFNPLAALLQGQSLPQAPRVGAPPQPNRGGIMGGGGPGLSSDPGSAGVTLATGISGLVNGFVQMKSQQKEQAWQEVQTGLAMKQAGLPVDETKLQKALKKTKMGDLLNWDTPQPMAGQQPQGPPEQTPAFQIGGGQDMPPVQFPQGMIPPSAPPPGETQPPIKQGMMSKIGQAMGMTAGPIAQNSQGTQAMQSMLQMAGQSGQMQRAGQMQQAQAQQQDSMLKQHITTMGLLALGVDPRSGKPVDQTVSRSAATMLTRFQQAQKGTATKLDGPDISYLIDEAEKLTGPMTPEQKKGLVQPWLFASIGADKIAGVTANIAKELMDNGVAPTDAYRQAGSLATGTQPTDLPKVSSKRMAEFLKQKLEITKEFPSLRPEVSNVIDGLLIGGRTQEAMGLLNRSTSKTTMGEMRSNRQVDLQAKNTQLREGELGVSGMNAQTARMNANESVTNNSYMRGMGSIKELMSLATNNGKKALQGDDLRKAYELVQSISPIFRIQPGDKGWFTDSNPTVSAPAGFNAQQTPMDAAPPGFGSWFTDTFAPALNQMMMSAPDRLIDAPTDAFTQFETKQLIGNK